VAEGDREVTVEVAAGGREREVLRAGGLINDLRDRNGS
jgi:hypothetical protein